MADVTASTERELADLAPDLRVRVRALIEACPHPLGITSAWRSRAEQQRLYDGWRARKPGFNPANPPGRSKHEHTSPRGKQPPAGRPAADAADLTLTAWGHWVHENAHRFGLHFPIRPNPQARTPARRRGEPWHVESNGKPYNPPEEDVTTDDIKAIAAAVRAEVKKDIITVLRAKDQPSIRSLDERLTRIEQALGSGQ